MSLTERLFEVANIGAEWVLWLLLILSVLSIGLMGERAFFYLKHRADIASLQQRLAKLLGRGEFDRAAREFGEMNTMEAQVLAAGLRQHQMGATSVGELMTGALTGQKQRYERLLTFFATLGSNAPFIGLFGTVLGIIQAFGAFDMDNLSGGPEVLAALMGPIAEALVATGVGLLVAIPAVVAYNIFKARVKTSVGNTEQLVRTLLAYLSAEDAPRPASAFEEANEHAAAAVTSSQESAAAALTSSQETLAAAQR